MKTFLKLIAVVALAAAFLAPSRAPAQVAATSIIGATTNAYTIVGTSSTNISALGRPIEVTQGRGLGLSALYTGGSSIYTTGVVAIYLAPSVDGTNYATDVTQMIRHHFTPNGATAVVSYTNIPPGVLDNIRYVKLHTITNAMTATNMAASFTLLTGRR